MEYVDGEDVASLLRRVGRLPAEKGLRITEQLCAGLTAAPPTAIWPSLIRFMDCGVKALARTRYSRRQL